MDGIEGGGPERNGVQRRLDALHRVAMRARRLVAGIDCDADVQRHQPRAHRRQRIGKTPGARDAVEDQFFRDPAAVPSGIGQQAAFGQGRAVQAIDLGELPPFTLKSEPAGIILVFRHEARHAVPHRPGAPALGAPQHPGIQMVAVPSPGGHLKRLVARAVGTDQQVEQLAVHKGPESL